MTTSRPSIRTRQRPAGHAALHGRAERHPDDVVQHHESRYFSTRCCDYFDRLLSGRREAPPIMAIAIHPYISGQPLRIKYLEQVYDYVNNLGAWCTGMARRSTTGIKARSQGACR